MEVKSGEQKYHHEIDSNCVAKQFDIVECVSGDGHWRLFCEMNERTKSEKFDHEKLCGERKLDLISG
jgi:hypothetical protein